VIALFLAKRHHPDQGGTHHDFVRVKKDAP